MGAWVIYLRWKDKVRPEPPVIIAVSLAAGALSVGSGLLGYRVLDGLGRTVTWGALAGDWSEAIPAALSIGLVEESAKLLPVSLVAWGSRHFDELWDGPVYAAAAAVGFAFAETLSLLFAGELGLVDGIARAIAAPITHAVLSAPAGLGLAHAVLHRRWWALLIGLGASIVLHGAYDLFLAQPGTHVLGAAVIAGAWLWLLWVGRDLVRRRSVPR